MIFDATGQKEGRILLGYDLIPYDKRDLVTSFKLTVVVPSGQDKHQTSNSPRELEYNYNRFERRASAVRLVPSEEVVLQV